MKRVLASGFLVFVGAAILLLHHGAARGQAPGGAALANLAAQCASSIDSTGFGQVQVSQNLNVLNEKGAVTTNCTIHLSQGAKLTISNSQMTTQHLVVVDDTAGAEGVSLQIQNSRITSSASGLYVHFSHAADSVSVQNSTLDYPRSAWIVIHGDGSGSDAGGGRIELLNVTINSTDPNSDGIRLGASESGGVARFLNDKFNTPALTGQALLFAGTCSALNVQGAPPSCSP